MLKGAISARGRGACGADSAARRTDQTELRGSRGTDALFLTIRNAGTGTIQLFELDTRRAAEPTPLGIFVKTFADISVHPDGRQLAFLDAEWLTEFWRIEQVSPRRSPPPFGVQPRHLPRGRGRPFAEFGRSLVSLRQSSRK